MTLADIPIIAAAALSLLHQSITPELVNSLKVTFSSYNMVSDNKAFQPLDIKLFAPHDDDEDLFFKKLLLSLVGGEITPDQAANDLDKWIVEKANKDFEERKKHPDPWNVPSPEDPSCVAPNPSGLITCFFESFARLGSAFPPGHAGQDRLIQFLEALRAMPMHEVPNYLPNDPPEDWYHWLELWPFGGSWLALTEVFRTEAEGTLFPFTDPFFYQTVPIF